MKAIKIVHSNSLLVRTVRAYIFYGEFSAAWHLNMVVTLLSQASSKCLKCRSDLKLQGRGHIPTGRGLQLINWPQFAPGLRGKLCCGKWKWKFAGAPTFCRSTTMMLRLGWGCCSCSGSCSCLSGDCCCCRHMLGHNLCCPKNVCALFPYLFIFLCSRLVFVAVVAGVIWGH